MTKQPTVPIKWNSTMGPLPSNKELKAKKNPEDTYIYKRAQTCLELYSLKMKIAEEKFLEQKNIDDDKFYARKKKHDEEAQSVFDKSISLYKQKIEAAKKIIGEDKPIVVKKPIPLAIVEKSEEEIMKENKIDFHNNVSSLFFGGGEEEQEGEEIEEATEEQLQEAKARQKAMTKKPVVCEAIIEPPLTPVNEDYEEARKLAMMSEEEELAHSRSMRGYPNILPAPDKPMTKPKREVKRAIGQNIQLYPIPPLEG